MKTIIITVLMCVQGPKEINAYPVAPGLAVHRTVKIDGFGKTWAVTHTNSGYSLGDGFSTRLLATQLATELAAVGDWDRPVEELTDKGFQDRVREIVQRYGVQSSRERTVGMENTSVTE